MSGQPAGFGGKVCEQPAFRGGKSHIQRLSYPTTLLVLKSFLNFLHVNEPGEKSEKTGKKGNRLYVLPSNEEKLREIQ